jgi:hypothetical protein
MKTNSKNQNLFSPFVLFLAIWCLGFGISCFAVERRPGSIKTSDGLELKGEIWFNNGEVKIYEGDDAADGRFVRVLQNEIASIVFSVKKSSMEKPWRFKNAGSDEKEFLDGQYPLIELKSETRLKNGQLLKGHLQTAPVNIRTQGRENPMDWDTKKWPLKYQHKGDVGQTEKDIPYVTAISFDDAGAVTAASKGAITGVMKGLGNIEQVSAYGIKRGRSYDGKPGKDKQSFHIANLPEDTYDIVVLTDTGIYAGLSDDAAKTEGRALETDDLAAINEKIKNFNDFFDDQRALIIKGKRDAAKVLVYQARTKPIVDQQDLRGRELNRLDIWNWHMRQTEWAIDTSSRANLLRYTENKAKKRDITLVPKLGAVPVGTEPKTVEVNATDATGQVLKP